MWCNLLTTDEELAVFPVENDYLPVLKTTLTQAREIDILEHRLVVLHK